MKNQGLTKNSIPIVFELIHSMESSERGYFIKFSGSLGKGEKSLQLFEILSNMNIYDKDKVISKLGKGTNSRNLTALYHHLYGMIVRSLRSYHESKRPKDLVRNLIVESEILYEKGLKRHAAKTLRKAHKMAEELQDYLLLMDISILALREEFSNTSKDLISVMNHSYEKLIHLHSEFGNELEMRKSHHLVLGCFRIGRGNPIQQESLKKIIEHPLLADSEDPTSFFARYYKYSAKANEAFIYRDREIAHAYFRKMIDLWEANPKIIAANPISYRNLISNYLNNSVPLKKADDFHQQMDNLQKIKTGSLMQRVELFQSIVLLRQLYSLNYCDLDATLHHIETILHQLSHVESHMAPSRLASIQCNFIFIYFINSDLDSCIDWVNLILRESRKDIRKDIKSFAAIMEMIIHYEQGNINYAESIQQSLRRKKKQLFLPDTFSSLILSGMESLVTCPSDKAKLDIYKTLTADINGLKKNGIRPLGMELILWWVKAKSEGTTVLGVFNGSRQKGLRDEE